MAVPKIKDLALPRRTVKRERANLVQALVQYLKDVRSEFRKVIWPDRQQLVASTFVVLVTLVFFVVVVGILDFVFSQLIQRVLPVLGGG